MIYLGNVGQINKIEIQDVVRYFYNMEDENQFGNLN